MCGIFGWYLPSEFSYHEKDLKQDLKLMFRLSESRGKEAAGVAVRNDALWIYKAPMTASKMIRDKRFKSFYFQALQNQKGPLSLIGHTRLVTDGNHFLNNNNQPVLKKGAVIVHNGIITNQKELWLAHPGVGRETDVDTEIILSLFLDRLLSGDSFSGALKFIFNKIKGTASIGILSSEFDGLLLATNNGSLYYSYDRNRHTTVFASEYHILCRFMKKSKLFKEPKQGEIEHLKPNNSVFIDHHHKTLMNLSEDTYTDLPIRKSQVLKIVDYGKRTEEALQSIRRCSKCVLPETMPFIEFDSNGVCNYCHNYQKMAVQGQQGLEILADQIRSGNNKPDCIAMFSGGRDSCYGLHYITRELGLQPLAFTYDWGMITDLGRRNQSRMCGELGVEHILVSAEINRKRYFIRKNIEAWLKRPDLGMVPIFMAGDKQYFYYIDQIKKSYNISTVFVFENPMEATRFKSGFCGVDESGKSSYDINIMQKIRLFTYYGTQYLLNPRYINLSIFDSMFALWSYYFTRHNFTYMFRYVRWDEKEINRTLINNYDWEIDKESSTTWRIGDGTSAFYNYIYITIAGFTENDTLRSNQIREGDITRTEALELICKENQPRWASLEWYAKTIGFNLNEALATIHAAPKRYSI